MNVTLRPWTAADIPVLAELCAGAERKYLSDRLPDPYTERDAEKWIHMTRDHDGKDGLFRAVLADGEAVGNISVEQKTDVYRRDAELGYFLRRDLWSQGIMTEAVRLICAAAFRELDIVRITALAYEPNAASRRVLEKNGFKLEGVMEHAAFKDGTLYNLCVYRILK